MRKLRDVSGQGSRFSSRGVVQKPTRCPRALKSDKFAAVTSELGAAIGGGLKCSFVIIPLVHVASR